MCGHSEHAQPGTTPNAHDEIKMVAFARVDAMLASAPPDKSRILQALQGLTDRLSAPDLTMAEAQDLRPKLLRLLESIEIDASPRTNLAGDRCVRRETDRRGAL
jgi:hypothetical protein